MTTAGDAGGLDALAREALDSEDVRVLDHLARLYDRIDPVPRGLVDRVQFGITLDALQAEVAELQRVDDLVGVRGEDTAAARTVTFTSESLTTMITVTLESSERARIDGWIAPGGGVSVEVRTSEGTRTTTADPDGRFVVEGVARGMVQLLVRPPAGEAGPPVVTPSIEI